MPEPFPPPGPHPADRPASGPDPLRPPGEVDVRPDLGASGADAGEEATFPRDLLPGARADRHGPMAADGPLREIAHAFRMNAEALHTLKQMQVELTNSVQRGDRSELVLQGTRALNDTFRNLSSVQRELLTRLDGSRRGGTGGRGPLVPLMLLGLLVVVLGATYVILDQVRASVRSEPGVDPLLLAQRERDSWKEGRREGAEHADRELRRLQDALNGAEDRTRKLERDLDAKLEKLAALERDRRLAELERDEFAGQVRKAQNEIVAKQVLEEEVESLRSQLTSASRELTDLRIGLDIQRRQSSFYRQRLADVGMDLPPDDPPYRPPGEDAARAPAVPPAVPPEPAGGRRAPFINLLLPGAQDAGGAGGARGAPAPGAGEGPTGLPQPETPGLRPPVVRKRAPVTSAATADVERVRTRLNELLDATPQSDGETWQVTRIDGIARDRLAGVVLMRYDAAGRLLYGVEARDLRISADREAREVAFDVQDGVRFARDQRVPLPAEGLRFVVAEGEAANDWADAGLTMIRSR